jgi:3-dehydroquinate synthetase
LLNLGHTVGHALESEAGGALLHGEAVGLGLLAACRVSAALGHPDLEPRLVLALARAGLPADLTPHLTEAVLARLAVDKKRAGAEVGFLAIREVGRCESVAIPLVELQRILRR